MARRFPSLLRLVLLAAVALVATGCGNKQDVHTLGETEGIYVDVGELVYQVQLSRVLNPNDVEDRAYLKGLAPGVEPPAKGETWFAIFMRVSNPTADTRKMASSFRIVDTQENEYEPVNLDLDANPFAYQPAPIRPGAVYPDANSVSGEGDIQGSLLLFKVTLESLANRPLELFIDSPLPPPYRKSAIIDLDV